MVQKIIHWMEKYNMISENDSVAAGISGGADSLCLLFVLLEYRKKVPFQLTAVHVNHGIRKEAARDAEFVRSLCEQEKVPFYLKEADVKELAAAWHLSEEEAGRRVRYEAFREALRSCSGEKGREGKIAVAHHQGDSAETLLFHLFRGTGIYGMTGILPVNGNIIRPLLACSREEIEQYLMEREQEWCIDSTNEEDTYTRNKIRHHILEYAKKEINPKAIGHTANAALQMAAFREYLEGEVKKMMQKMAVKKEEAVSVDLGELKSYPSFLQGQFLLAVLETISPGRRDIGMEHIQAILALLEKNGTKKLSLPGRVEVVKEYGILWIKSRKNLSLVEKERSAASAGEYPAELEVGKSYPLPDGSILELGLRKAQDFRQIEEKKYTKYFDYDKIRNCLRLRYRQAGDYITINDQGQEKTLKEYFIHEKIPARIRYEIPLVADDKHILWTIGYRISAYYKVTPETKTIIQMTIRRNEDVREN